MKVKGIQTQTREDLLRTWGWEQYALKLCADAMISASLSKGTLNFDPSLSKDQKVIVLKGSCKRFV